MTPNENVLKVARDLLSDLNTKLAVNTEDQQALQREIASCENSLIPVRTKSENAALEAKAARERAEDWSQHLGMEPDGGSIPQQEMLKALQNKVEELNENKRVQTEILNRLQMRLEQPCGRLAILKDQRQALIVQRDRAAADVERLLKS